ncbi:MAG: ribonucleoside-diphosphate reductase subunit alpha [Thermomicrobium sp.]|nr:ribonucleoside-diphosphate reductase subunit alpha [Thermomicrobium sp.]
MVTVLSQPLELRTTAPDDLRVLEERIVTALGQLPDRPEAEREAAALLLERVAREADDGRELPYPEHFRRFLERGIACGALDPRLAEFDLGRLACALDPRRDGLLGYTAVATLADRYLVRDPETRRILERPQALFMRVAMGLALAEHPSQRTEWALRWYELMSSLRYLPSTPTLFNAGTPHHQLASCYLAEVEDSLESILGAAYEFGLLAKYAGGIGAAVTRIRAVGAPVRGINGTSGGLVPFLHLYDALIASISQGGRRRGTMCVYLEPWHLEVEAFLDLRRNAGDPYRRTHQLNTALWIPDEFMRRIEADEPWYLFDPSLAPELPDLVGRAFTERYAELCRQAEAGYFPRRAWRKLPARELWLAILASLMETGHPWLTFKDAGNLRSQLRGVGVIHSSNLCTEIFLPTNREEVAVCNLGSVNLARHCTPDGEIDWERLGDTVRLAMRALDNVIDVNLYPSERAERANERNRPVGLGMMGFAELLARRGFSYADPRAAELADRIAEFLSYRAIEASCELARERGCFPTFAASRWAEGVLPIDTLADLAADRGIPVDVDRSRTLDWDSLRVRVRGGMRNGAVMAIAPTATIALIAGTTPSLDPYYANVFSRQTLSGKFLEVNPVLVEELRRRDMWERVLPELVAARGDLRAVPSCPADLVERFPTAYQVPPEAYVEVAARVQKWVDMGVSRNLYHAADRPSQLETVYRLAWRKGLKSTYYCFVRPRMEVEQSTVVVNKARRRPQWVQLVERAVLAREGVACGLDGSCESCQ